MLCAAIAFSQATTQPRPPQPQEIPHQLWPPHPADKMEKRYLDIDAKRATGIQPEDMLPRSREFKRIDSTYYVGWMLEGEYKYEHAADYLGYKNAIPPLERASCTLQSMTMHRRWPPAPITFSPITPSGSSGRTIP